MCSLVIQCLYVIIAINEYFTGSAEDIKKLCFYDVIISIKDSK